VPTLLQVSPELQATGDVMTVNFGPNHPSTHGVLRLIVDLYGEDVVGLEAIVGYLHTGFEKTMEQKTWWKAITYPERIDYLSFQAGGLAEDVPLGFFKECRRFIEWMPKAVDEYESLVDKNQIWLERTQGVGLLSAEDAIALGQSGPVLRGSGVDWDLRKVEPYLAYDAVDFDVPVYPQGDVYARFRVRMDEMLQSNRIIAQCLDRLENMGGEPWIADDRKV